MNRLFHCPSGRSLRTLNAWFLSLLFFWIPLAPIVASVNRSSATGPIKIRKTLTPTEKLNIPFSPLVTSGPNITATLTDAFIDNNSTGRADPGSTVTYTATVTNNGSADATSVQYNETIDPNTTFVAGSLKISPLALDDAYNATSGTLNVLAPGVLSNDTLNSAAISSYGVNGNEQTGVGSSTPTAQTGTISLNADGSFSYTPPASFSGVDTFKYILANATGNSTATVTFTVGCPTITVTNPSTTTGIAGAAFSQTFTQSGGVGTSTFAINSGTLPTGLTLAGNGTLSGAPTQTGTFPITVKATDSNGCTATGSTYTLVINCQTITVTNPSNTTGTAGTAFSQTFTQSGGVGTTNFTLNSGTLPNGLTLASNGTLSGTPTQTGSFPITVKATDSNGCTGIGPTYTLSIGCPTMTVTNPSTTSGTVDVAFSQSFTQSGGVGTTNFALNSGSLPNGLTLAANGTLSGTPTVPGTFPITVKATDANGCVGISATYNLVIACQTITVTNPATSTGTVDAAFSQTFMQSGVGAHTPATFTLNSGTLPSGLTLSSAGVLSGTPGQSGTFNITVKATDVNGCFGVSPTYSLVIACQTITLTNPVTTTGTVDAAFSQTFTQSGVGTHMPATFTINSGTLPAGLSLSTAGVLSGTPGVPGTFPITVKVTDANGCSGISSTYTLVIACQTITITNPAITVGTYNTAFSQTFTQTGVGSHTPTTFTVNSGALPAGLTLSTAGVLSGTPTVTGNFPITVKVTDANNCTGTGATYNLAIAPKLLAETYTDVGNTQLNGGLAAPSTPSVSVVAVSNNDSSDTTITYAIVTNPTHGTMTTFNNTGTFLYTPTAGNTTTDTFTYGGTSNGVTAQQTATINFNGLVWFVDNATASGTNDGRSNTPFKTMTAVNSAATNNGDFIYVFKGSGTTTGAYTMKPSQQLIGAGATLNVPAVTPILTIAGNVANIPTLGGTLTLANSVTVNGFGMSTGSSTAITASSVTGISVTTRSISTSGAVNGISLTNTTGSFTVTGDGGGANNGSGGTISGSTGPGILLSNATNISLGYMNIQNGTDDGINGTSVTGFTLTRCNVTGNGNSNVDEGIQFVNLLGTSSITNCTVTGNAHNNMYVDNNSGTLTSFNVSNSNFSTIAAGNGNNGILFVARTTAVVTAATVSGCTFNNIAATGIQVDATDTATITSFVVTGGTFNTESTGVNFTQAGSANTRVDILSSNFQFTQGAINVFSASGSTGGGITSKIQGNTIGTQNSQHSGSFNGVGIRVNINGQAHGVASVDNNQFHEIPNSRGIECIGRLGTGGANFSITNNHVFAPGAGTTAPGCTPSGCELAPIYVEENDANNVCSKVLGNITYDPQTFPLGGEFTYYLRKPGSATFKLEGTNATGNAEIIATNDPDTDVNVNAGVQVVAAGTCGTFPPLLLAPGGVGPAKTSDNSSSVLSFNQFSTRDDSPPFSFVGRRWSSTSASTSNGRAVAQPAITAPGIMAGYLNQQQLDTIVAAAIKSWASSGLTPSQLNALRNITFDITDLAGAYLGESGGQHVLIDRNADGKGWYVSSGSSYSLFDHAISTTRRYTDPMNAPAGHIDLLTVIAHEMGHKLGLDDLYTQRERDNLMYGYLTVGERRLPAQGQAHHAKLRNKVGTHFLSLEPAGSGQARLGSRTLAHHARSKTKGPLTARALKASVMMPPPPATVNANIGTLPAGKSVTLTFQVTLNNAMPSGTSQVSTQGTVSYTDSDSNFYAPVSTDDPDTGAPNDPTVTPVDAPTAADGVVSGRITTSDGAPVEGAVIRLSGSQSRKTITDSNGNYHFDNVETNGFYTVTASRVNYGITPSQRSFSQLGNNTDAAFTATFNGATANPLDTPEYFVRQHYLDFLGREPDEGGFNYWSDQILACGLSNQSDHPFDRESDRNYLDETVQDCVQSRKINVSAAFFFSIEFQGTGGLVDCLYRVSYQRRPLYGEFMSDVRSMNGIIVGQADWQNRLNAGKTAFIQAWMQRPAFRTAYDNLANDDYVDKLISNTDVNYTTAERDALVNGLTSGALTRARVLQQITEDGRFVAAKFSEQFVLMEYFGYLRRDPDEGGYQFWLAKLNQFHGNFEQAELVKAFLISAEYRRRFPR
jgi:hypothetical protein